MIVTTPGGAQREIGREARQEEAGLDIGESDKILAHGEEDCGSCALIFELSVDHTARRLRFLSRDQLEAETLANAVREWRNGDLSLSARRHEEGPL